MKLRTSFFNTAVLRKNLTRFAPLWVLTAILEILCLLTVDMEQPRTAAWRIAVLMGPLTVLVMIYAAIVASCLFGDLFNSRMCNGLHAIPMRREGWLLTNLASGFLFALIPSFTGGAVAAVMLQEYYWVALLWQAVILLQFVFFFGMAVFSAICAGKRLGMMAIYVLANFLAVLIYWIAKLFYQPLLPNVVLSVDAFTRFSPVIPLAGADYMDYGHYLDKAIEGICAQDWNYLLICVGVGAVFLALSWLLYRKRHLETAGDFISFRPLKMVFLLAYTFAVGAFVHSVFGALATEENTYSFLVVGILIGWFTGWMLLERTVKVFHKKVILGFLAFGALFAGSMALTAWDPAGIVTYVPQTKNVESVCLYTQENDYIYDETYAYDGGRYIKDESGIARVQVLHRSMIDTVDAPDEECITVVVQYRLQNGKQVIRSYDIPVGSETAEDLSRSFSDIQMVLHTNDNWETVKENIQSIGIRWKGGRKKIINPLQEQEMETVLAAFEADCMDGTMAQDAGFHERASVASIEIIWKDQQYGVRTEYVDIYAGSTHLYEILKKI